jgi:hypothetical protein
MTRTEEVHHTFVTTIGQHGQELHQYDRTPTNITHLSTLPESSAIQGVSIIFGTGAAICTVVVAMQCNSG